MNCRAARRVRECFACVRREIVVELMNGYSFNYNKGNIQQDPPMTEEWFSRDIYTRTLSPLLSPLTTNIMTNPPKIPS
jgi:hypothetical protein